MESNLRNIIKRQKDDLIALEKEIEIIENSDLTIENAKLKAEVDKLAEMRAKSEQNEKALSEQNAGLKNALHEQIFGEKAKLVEASKEKLEIYFGASVEGEQNKLSALENNIKNRIDKMRSALHQNYVDVNDELHGKLNDLSELLNVKMTEARKAFAQSHGAFSDNEREEFESLKNEQITDEKILAVTKKNNMERFVGLNLINIVGVLLIIIGVIAAARYTYTLLPDLLKGVLMFALGAAMLVAGELMNRKKPNIFSMGITAGGVGVLYAALATSYFGLKILDMYPALILCILITAAVFFLSTRYNSQTILALALVGGYLPIFSISSDRALIYGAMIYFITLNLLALLVSFRKKWSVAAFTGLALNIGGTILIANNFYAADKLQAKIIAVLYILFAYMIYTLIPVVSTYAGRQKFMKRDVVLLALNTFFSSLIMFALFYEIHWDDYMGALAVVFAAVYLLLGWLIERKFSGEKNTQALFYLTGLAFVILIIPFQFGRVWLTLGWLAEGVALTAYGIVRNERAFKRAGYCINALCLFSFIYIDLILEVDYLFAYKYLAVTLGSLVILGAYIYNKTLSGVWQRIYKYAVIINIWIYSIYLCCKISEQLYFNSLSESYLLGALSVTLSFLIAYAAPKIKTLTDTGVKIISIIIYLYSLFFLFILNRYDSPFYNDSVIQAKIIGSAVLILISLLSVFAVYDLIKLIVMERKLGVEFYPLIISAYFLVILTHNLIVQYDLSFASAWLSIIYVLTALAWIVFGFAKRYSFIRKFGLGLALLSVVKLFIVDLSSLTEGYRIISYFALGATLVAISFVYQYFNKRLELKL